MSRPISPITKAVKKIAARTGLTSKYLRQLHKDGMPIDNIESALKWLNTRPDKEASGDDDGSVAALRRQRIRLVKLQSQKAEIEIQVRKGELASRAEIEAAFVAIGSSMRVALLALRKELPPALLGLPLNKSQAICDGYMRELLGKLSSLSSEYWKTDATKDLENPLQ